ncbi:magnesium-translocating P-type ATPase [Pseudomonas sp. RTC3]|uniref:magnesium-translocating P-type ATPase n=1 Tax=Pseudomonas sp. 5C2 TaxID=3048588 RepID=UPI002AB5648C|nr:magnesium-translocating P-type ATPase [Pseudomonas sp. 5C2]MDY7565153.1 magnesium-translocating P-type ATPase [Pseudomonas sp. 5C2]MEB0064772.1 magnesium-translocating P-type ATPase [Pseudomonas sp. RTC3]MEB0243246.1 magnesium-translocating P-type ATPase [Pseudomonas sp. 5C2]
MSFESPIPNDPLQSSLDIDPRVTSSLLWVSWLVGTAMLAAVIAVALHLSDVEAFGTLLERAEPLWLIVAIVLQALTYLAQGQVFRGVLKAGHAQLSLWDSSKLSLMKLFVDQALPSSGISGAFAVIAFLIKKGVARPLALACLVLDLSAYFFAYVLTVGVALFIVMLQGHATTSLIATCLVFAAVSLAAAIIVPRLSGHSELQRRFSVKHHALVGKGLALLTGADSQLARNRSLLWRTTFLELVIILLDCLTLWVLVRSLGVSAQLPGLFAGFMLASVLRSVGIVPGGLGAFEAAAVVTLHWIGIEIPVALSATLLFRGLTFWLPMLPGMWLARSGLGTPSIKGDVPISEVWWQTPAEELLRSFGSSVEGLSSEQAKARLRPAAPVGRSRPHGLLRLTIEQMRSPLVIILIVGALVALLVGDWINAAIVLLIVLISALLSAWYENRASTAVEQLRRKIATLAVVRRAGKILQVPASDVVPGDIFLLSAGSLIAADGRVLSARDCFISQSLLTGETYPVEKLPGDVPAEASLIQRSNCVFMGTSVRSGTAEVLATRYGDESEFGQIAKSLSLRPPETEFERGLRHFGGLLLRVMLVITFLVFGINILLHRPTLDTLLFAIALSVGLSPELLPAILSLTLAKGAQRMAARGVIVRHLSAIENLGAMDILCTDKTGTLTRGVVALNAAVNVEGEEEVNVLQLALFNAHFQTGMSNAMDDAITTKAQASAVDVGHVSKLDEIPYDFGRKRLSVVVAGSVEAPILLVTKGAVENVLEVCTHLCCGNGTQVLDETALAAIRKRFAAWSEQGFRVLGIATRSLPAQARYSRNEEVDLTFRGFLLFFDPPEPGVKATMAALAKLGVQVKIISGDSHLVARYVASAVGLNAQRIITGSELALLKDEVLMHLAPTVTLFAEVDPNQKERIIRALQKTGHVVGFLGDGINDAPALQAADIGISVQNAADVAKQAADFVLLEHDLNVLREGIDEGRHTFANTLKYIFIVSSANFGNMISMALASLFLPFLPLLAKQILLNNFLSDIPALGIASDNVDREWEQTPHRWNLAEVRNFMVVFGLVSSLFDVFTFGALYWLVGIAPDLFRSGWFVESLLTQLLTIFIVRTYKPFHKSHPGRMLLVSASVIGALTVLLPYSPAAAWFGLVPLPLGLLAVVLSISLLYVAAAEWVKRGFYRKRPIKPRPLRRRGDS